MNEVTQPLLESVQNPLVKATAALGQKKARQESGQLLVETRHPIEEAIKAGLVPKHYFYLPQTPQAQRVLWSDVAVAYPVSEGVMKKMASTDSLPPCLAVFEAPDLSWEAMSACVFKPRPQKTPLYLLLDKLQDPGNLGTILRSALAFEADGVILSAQSVEALSPKVIRASAGLVFSCPVIQSAETVESLLSRVEFSQCQWLFTTSHPLVQGRKVHCYKEVDFKTPSVLVFGNEGQGLDASLLSKAAENPRALALRIPMSEAVESLNISVSASILLAEASQQRSQI
ncbi:MAG: RNA methyltransferase [Vampirovibrionales bacterium]|nr:RNA methyltransferase [Vampirovibrionales bacterium]